MTAANAQWWGFSKEHGWVVLDREIACNTPGTRGDLMFLRCRDEKVFMLKRELWRLPGYQFAPNHLRALSEADAARARAEFEELQDRWPDLQRSLMRQHQELEDAKDPAARETAQRQRETAATARKQRMAMVGASKRAPDEVEE
jgi:hypothetical protein